MGTCVPVLGTNAHRWKGQVVDRFDMLANPGRKVVPHIARLTRITDEMLAGEPPVDEVIARFADFCRGFVLVGHNVKSCDIPHIARAAKRAGVAMENEFFDTYQYAKSSGTCRVGTT